MSANLLHLILSYLFLIGFSLGASTTEDCDKVQGGKEKPMPLKLKEDLLCDYDRTVRPVLAHTTTITIDVQFLIKHVDLKEYSNALHVESWFAMKWTDEHLKWNPEDYGDIKVLLLTSDDIWVPDISVYNKFAYGNSRIIDLTCQCIIRNTGMLVCVPQTVIEGNCVPDLRYWPFDQQNCTVKIGSWFHHGDEINFNDTEPLLENYLYRQNAEWLLKNVTKHKDPGRYSCCPNNTYPSLVYSFLLQRQSGPMLAVFIVPIVIFIIISLLTLWMDPKSPERLYLIALNIPCHIMFLANALWTIAEPGDSVPYIILLLRDSLLLAALTLVETMVVRCLLDTRSNTPPWLVTSFTMIVNSKPGQVLLFSELNPENAVANLSADDGESLVETKMERPKEWYLLARALDRIYFAVYILTYFIMLVVCVPK